jgi:hypothetical protein
MRFALLCVAFALAVLTGVELGMSYVKNDALAAALAIFPAVLCAVAVREYGRRSGWHR